MKEISNLWKFEFLWAKFVNISLTEYNAFVTQNICKIMANYNYKIAFSSIISNHVNTHIYNKHIFPILYA